MRVEADGEPMRGLAPVAVLPERQRQGVGSALVEAGLAEARAAGIDIVFLLGEPEYYGRFGFEPLVAQPFASPYAGPYFQALVLSDIALPASGSADYAPAFAALG
jgi:putative acetyltransferase